jgi:hypothetical protein
MPDVNKDSIFWVVRHMVSGVHDGTFDVIDTRTKAVVANFATVALAGADSIARNKVVGNVP